MMNLIIENATYEREVTFILDQIGGVTGIRAMTREELERLVLDQIGFLSPTIDEIRAIVAALETQQRDDARPATMRRRGNGPYK